MGYRGAPAETDKYSLLIYTLDFFSHVVHAICVVPHDSLE